MNNVHGSRVADLQALAGDEAKPGGPGYKTVSGLCPLERHVRPARVDAGEEWRVHLLAFGFEEAGGDVDAGGAELGQALAVDERVGVEAAGDDPGDLGG